MPGTSLIEPSRAAVEAALRDEQALLQALAAAICAGLPPEEWDGDLRDALARALEPGDASPGEQWKARALRRHLYGPEADPVVVPPEAPPTDRERRRAERVRADLARLVPLRALGRRGTARSG